MYSYIRYASIHTANTHAHDLPKYTRILHISLVREILIIISNNKIKNDRQKHVHKSYKIHNYSYDLKDSFASIIML